MAKLSQKSERGDGDPLCAGTLDCADTVFVDDGRVEMDNNAAERALRTVAIGRKNYLFAGSDAGGERAAAIYSLLGSAKLNGIDPEAYMSRGAAPHRRSSHQPDRRTAAVESVSGHAGGGGGMTLPPPQRNRAHNLRIVDTISNETESLDWVPLESKLLAAAAYVAPRRILYLRFRSGEVYRYFTFPADQYQDFLDAESKGRFFLAHIRNRFPYQKLPR